MLLTSVGGYILISLGGYMLKDSEAIIRFSTEAIIWFILLFSHRCTIVPMAAILIYE